MRLLRNRIRAENRFEVINRNCVCPVRSKEFVHMSQNLVQRSEGSVLSNKHKVCQSQRSWNLTNSRRPLMRRRQHQASKGQLNSHQESTRRNLVGIQELPRKEEMGSV